MALLSCRLGGFIMGSASVVCFLFSYFTQRAGGRVRDACALSVLTGFLLLSYEEMKNASLSLITCSTSSYLWV